LTKIILKKTRKQKKNKTKKIFLGKKEKKTCKTQKEGGGNVEKANVFSPHILEYYLIFPLIDLIIVTVMYSLKYS